MLITSEVGEDMMFIDARRVRAVGALLMVAMLVACGGDAQADGTAAGDPEPVAEGFVRVINVEVREVVTSAFEQVIRLTGAIQADRDVTFSAEETGVIREIFVEKGHSVVRGQRLFKINDRVLLATTRQARAAAALARETWQRRKKLYEEDRIGSELDYLRDRYSSEQASATLEALEERLARTVVKAPISGVLESREVEVGTMVSPGTALGRIISLNPIKVAAGVPERFAADVHTGDPAKVKFSIMPDREFSGRISYVSSAVDPRNRTFTIELRLQNSEGIIKPEMIADIEVPRQFIADALVVPQEALVRTEEGFVAFVVTERDGFEVAEVRALELGPSQRNTTVVTSGLQEGDQLVVVGQGQVADGDRVKVVGR